VHERGELRADTQMAMRALWQREPNGSTRARGANGIGEDAVATQNQALHALLFLYQKVLAQDLPWLDGVVRAKRPARMPTVLTEEEVARLLDRLGGARGDILSPP